MKAKDIKIGGTYVTNEHGPVRITSMFRWDWNHGEQTRPGWEGHTVIGLKSDVVIKNSKSFLAPAKGHERTS